MLHRFILGKLLKKGVATKGFYTFIRHPQYLGLGLAALGLAIMWPRFLTLTLFAVMLFLYYLLAKDEERRMTNRFGESYIAYMNRTGMFLPRFIEKVLVGSSKPVTTTSRLRESHSHLSGASCSHCRKRIHFTSLYRPSSSIGASRTVLM